MQKKLPGDKTSLEAQWETKKGADRLLGGAFDSWGGKVSGLLHQESSAGALDLTGDLAVKMGCKSCQATRKNLATLCGEFLQEVGILEINGLGGDVEPTARHATVGAAEIGAALWCLWYAHGVFSVLILKRISCLLGLPMERVAAEIGIVFFLLEAPRGAEALLVAGRGVPGNGLSFGNRFGAFKSDDIAWHKNDS